MHRFVYVHVRTYMCMYMYTYMFIYIYICLYTYNSYALASISSIDKIIGLICKRALYKRQYSAKETYHLIDPTKCSHPI